MSDNFSTLYIHREVFGFVVHKLVSQGKGGKEERKEDKREGRKGKGTKGRRGKKGKARVERSGREKFCAVVIFP